MKKLLSILALLFAFSGSAFCADNITVYYFYGTPRCATCKKMEAYTQDVVNSMNDKSITYKGIDTDKAENKQYAKKYNLYTKAVVLSKMKDGKEVSKNLDEIWLKVKNENDFKNYIKSEINNFKGAK